MILRHDKSWFFWIHFENTNLKVSQKRTAGIPKTQG
jgi:hypothetical protein